MASCMLTMENGLWHCWGKSDSWRHWALLFLPRYSMWLVWDRSSTDMELYSNRYENNVWNVRKKRPLLSEVFILLNGINIWNGDSNDWFILFDCVLYLKWLYIAGCSFLQYHRSADDPQSTSYDVGLCSSVWEAHQKSKSRSVFGYSWHVISDYSVYLCVQVAPHVLLSLYKSDFLYW